MWKKLRSKFFGEDKMLTLREANERICSLLELIGLGEFEASAAHIQNETKNKVPISKLPDGSIYIIPKSKRANSVSVRIRNLSPILRDLLLRGAIIGYKKKRGGGYEIIDPDFWQDGASWDLKESTLLEESAISYHLTGSVVIRRDKLAALMKLAEAIDPDKTVSDKEVNQGGRPEKYDRELFLAEAFKILRDKPKTVATEPALMKKALEAYSEAGHPGGAPSEDWARPKIRKLWKILGRD